MIRTQGIQFRTLFLTDNDVMVMCLTKKYVLHGTSKYLYHNSWLVVHKIAHSKARIIDIVKYHNS